MIIEVKYNIGDSIRYIERKDHITWKPCLCCDKNGYIVGADGEKYDCPVCEGRGRVEGEIKTEEEEKTGTIKTIHVHFDSEMASFHGKPDIYYTTPQSIHHIDQEDIIERIFTEEE